jgi:hypothetical protein
MGNVTVICVAFLPTRSGPTFRHRIRSGRRAPIPGAMIMVPQMSKSRVNARRCARNEQAGSTLARSREPVLNLQRGHSLELGHVVRDADRLDRTGLRRNQHVVCIDGCPFLLESDANGGVMAVRTRF